MTAARRPGAAAVAVALAAVLLAAGTPAYATTTLAPNTPVVTGTPDTYAFATTLSYWSVVAVRPGPDLDVDLQVSDPRYRGILAGSYWGAGQTDLVAINSNGGFRAFGPYQAQVSPYSGSGQYSVMFWEDRWVMPVPTDPVGGVSTAVPLKYEYPVVAVQIYLQAGQGFRVNLSDGVRVFLAGSTPGVPGTYVRTRSQLENAYTIADNVPSTDGGHCKVFTVPAAGAYSMIVIWNSPWEPPPYDGGLAVFPQRYDPAMGDTLSDCPEPVVP